MKKISAYWKCQFLGWAAFILIAYGFNIIIYHNSDFFYVAFFLFLLGISFSHLLKLAIKKLQILEKNFIVQICLLPIITILFSLIGTYVLMKILILSGIWDVDALKKHQPDVFFYQVFFYNLFPILLTLSGWVLIYFLFHYVKNIRKSEQEKALYRYQIIELEAKALRAQMNPHFIFNCMNSIKSLIQKNENEKAIAYLATLSKLIRTVFQNSDKREITLYDEIETCRLYAQLESMRFSNKFNYEFNVDKTLDLKSLLVPALIVQPFIENAIWHGIMPKEEGGKLTVKVNRTDHTINCIIEDDGIGREISKQNKFLSKDPMHESKGEHLTQSRLDLDNLLNERKATIKITDKKDKDNKPCGTTVIISVEED